MSLRLFGSPVRVGLAIGLAASMLTIGPSPASAAEVGPEKRLTTNHAGQNSPELSGNRLVYSDFRNIHEVGGDPEDGEQGEDVYDIRVLDLKTGKDRLLTPKHLVAGRAAISGNRVVWNYYRKGRTDAIWYHNLKTGTHKRVPVAGGRNLEISGTRICYERNDRIYVYNFTTKKEKAVSPKYGADNCDISGKTVIWRDWRNSDNNGRDPDIYSYNLTTKKETRITTDAAVPGWEDPWSFWWPPKISGRHVVWTDRRNDTNGDMYVDTDIYSYDLVTRVETRITTADEAERQLPNISGNRIVWMQSRDNWANTDVYAFNLAIGVETRVTDDGSSGNPVIDGTRVVYQRGNLYMRTIP